jgi:FMN-dependent NADH-azoreductase
MNLLHVISSPRKQRSASLEAATAFTDAWRASNPHGVIDTLNVWEIDLPPFDGAALEAKYAGLEGKERTPDQKAAWAKIEALAGYFQRAELIVFSVPMWNFGIPYRLKHLIDAISHKDVLFTFDERGLLGLLGGKTVVVIAARGAYLGGDYPVEDFDHHTAYIATWCRMVGIKEVHTISIEKTLFGPKADQAARVKARIEAIALAKSIGRLI